MSGADTRGWWLMTTGTQEEFYDDFDSESEESFAHKDTQDEMHGLKISTASFRPVGLVLCKFQGHHFDIYAPSGSMMFCVCVLEHHL